MAKRVKIKPTKKNKQRFANTANRVNIKNLSTYGARGGVRL